MFKTEDLSDIAKGSPYFVPFLPDMSYANMNLYENIYRKHSYCMF